GFSTPSPPPPSAASAAVPAQPPLPPAARGEAADASWFPVEQASPGGAPVAPALHALSVSAVPEDQVEATIASLREAIAVHPEQRDLHRKLGFLLARQGRTAEAAREFSLARGEDQPA